MYGGNPGLSVYFCLMLIYHNEECSKSNSALCLLKESGQQFNVIEYLNNPPSVEEIKDILRKLNMKPYDLVRKNEPVYIENFLGKILSDEEWVLAMHEHPILIERPIIVKGDKAVIARPPEKMLEL